MSKVLIIKTGVDESFAPSPAKTVSLGDVLRTTVILPAFEGAAVTWVTSQKAYPLLAPNPRLNVMTEQDVQTGGLKNFDTIINLEKDPLWTDFLLRSLCREKLGFVDAFGSWTGTNQVNPPLRLEDIGSWQQGLFTLLGRTWQGEEYCYVNPALPVKLETVDVGLNWECGTKWPGKAWPKENWKELAQALSPHYSLSWQQGFDSLDEYATWIASCRTLITTDSLGLHLALALRKNVFALFGPTSCKNIHFYGRGRTLNAPCTREIPCMEMISVNNALKAFREFYRGSNRNEGIGKEQDFSSN